MDKLVWIDLEMTGLNPEQDKIIEIASIITDKHLNIIAEGPNLVINQSPQIMQAMDEWNTNQHNKSGLVKEVLNSKINTKDAEKITLNFLKQHLSANESPICGNSIYQDRRFLLKYMPDLEQFFHYRQFDISCLKIMMQNWHSEVDVFNKNQSNHRALDDIKDSIKECFYYKEIIEKWKKT